MLNIIKFEKKYPSPYYYLAMFLLMPLLFLSISAMYLPVLHHFTLDMGSLCLGVSLYLFSHVCRVVRLAFLTLDDNVKFRQLFRLHFHTAALSRMLPFKIGELCRIYILGSLFSRQLNAVMVVWIERLFDSLVIAFFLLLAAIFYPHTAFSNLTLISILSFFIVFSFLIFFVLPENLTSIKRVLIMRYNSAWILQVLKWVANTEQFVKLAHPILQKKIITLTLLSISVWLSEIVALAVMVFGINPIDKLTLAMMSLPERLTQEFYPLMSSITFTENHWNSLLTLCSLFFMGFICLYLDYQANINPGYHSLKAKCYG